MRQVLVRVASPGGPDIESHPHVDLEYCAQSAARHKTLDRAHRLVEAIVLILDESPAALAGKVPQGKELGVRRRDGLLDHDVRAGAEADGRQLNVSMWRG